MEQKGIGRILIDWVLRFGIIIFVVLGGSSSVSAQEKPNSREASNAKIVGERNETEETEGEDFVIVVRIPKPQAFIFSQRLKTKYDSIEYEEGFQDKIIESAKHPPF